MRLLRRVCAALSLTLILGVCVSSGNAYAQTLQALNFERVIALTSILTTITPQVSATGLAGLEGGSLEIHDLTIYNPQANTVTDTVFLLPAGSPLPTPLSGITPANTIAQFTFTVANIYITSLPYPAVLIVGNIGQSTATPYGSYQGGTSSLSVAYTSGSSPTITNVVSVVAGGVVDWAAKATGTVTVSAASTGGGGTTGGGGGTGTAPVVVVTGPGVSFGQEARLDASGSTDPGGLTLTYAWKSVGSPTATILSATSATTDVQFNSGPGTYNFSVTVTDSAGNTATGTVSVMYLGR
jgi:hypothetical protein